MVVQWQLPMKVAEKLVLRAVTRKNERRTTSNAGGGGRRSRSNSVASGGETEDSSKAENGDGDGASTEVCLVIGLVRLGMATNKATVVNKQIPFSCSARQFFSPKPRQIRIPCPTIGGRLRLSAVRRNDSVTSYATSVPFVVGVQQRDLDHNLKFVTQQLKARNGAGAAILAQCRAAPRPRRVVPIEWQRAGHRQSPGQSRPRRCASRCHHAARAEFADAELANQAEAAAKAAAAGGPAKPLRGRCRCC